MKFIKQLERLQRLDELIKNECISTPEDFAKKLGVSRSHLYRLIETLKDYGAEISFNRKQQCFYYKKPFIFKVLIPNTILSITEMKKISAGFSKNTIPSFFMRQNSFTFTPRFAQNKDINYKCL
jgi:predicted DNA-binding transcriptional regulator YafY